MHLDSLRSSMALIRFGMIYRIWKLRLCSSFFKAYTISRQPQLVCSVEQGEEIMRPVVGPAGVAVIGSLESLLLGISDKVLLYVGWRLFL